MKLDLNACWDEAIRLIALNREVVLILAGVFFFLPYAIFMTLIPLPDFAAVAGPSGQPNTAALEAAISGFFAQYWWAILLLVLVQTIGALALMAVVGDPRRPTVGDAVIRGTRLLATSVLAQLLVNAMALFAFFAVLVFAGLTGSVAVAMTLSLMALPLIFWLFTRLSLTNPVIAIEAKMNPLEAVKRSWRLTKGSGVRLSVFYLLLLIAFFVVSQVIGFVVGLVAALPGAEAAQLIQAVLSGLVSSIMTVIIYAVLASVHRQLARAERTSALDPA